MDVRRPAAPEQAPVETVEEGRPSVGEEQARDPVVAGAAAAPAAEEPPRAVAVAEMPSEQATLPPPLPPDVLATPTPALPLVEPEPPAPAPAKRRAAWMIGGAALLATGLAAGMIAVWSSDLVDSSDGEPSRSAQALSALAARQARAISIMAQPGATRLPVAGAEERLLLIAGMEGDAVLIVSRLERAPAGKTYEIWVISGASPKPAGLFRGGRDTVVPLTRVVPKGATVALTLERVGGSPSPTSAPLFVVTRS